MLPISDNRDIGPAAVVSCPKVNFKPRRACKCCPGCEYFDGLGMMASDTEAAYEWSDIYAIRCTHPIERRTQYFEVIEE